MGGGGGMGGFGALAQQTGSAFGGWLAMVRWTIWTFQCLDFAW